MRGTFGYENSMSIVIVHANCSLLAHPPWRYEGKGAECVRVDQCLCARMPIHPVRTRGDCQ